MEHELLRLTGIAGPPQPPCAWPAASKPERTARRQRRKAPLPGASLRNGTPSCREAGVKMWKVESMETIEAATATGSGETRRDRQGAAWRSSWGRRSCIVTPDLSDAPNARFLGDDDRMPRRQRYRPLNGHSSRQLPALAAAGVPGACATTRSPPIPPERPPPPHDANLPRAQEPTSPATPPAGVP